MKIMVLLWSTSVEKRIVALSLLFLFFFYFLFFGAFFYLAFPLFYLGRCSINDDHHTSIYLQLNDYNSILEQSMTIWMPPAVYREGQWIKSDIYDELCLVALPQIWRQLHDYARQYDNDEACHKWYSGKLHGIISRNGYGNAIIGRYGGYFEEDIMRFMCDRAYHITRFGFTGEVWTNSQGEKGKHTVPKRLAMMERWECV